MRSEKGSRCRSEPQNIASALAHSWPLDRQPNPLQPIVGLVQQVNKIGKRHRQNQTTFASILGTSRGNPTPKSHPPAQPEHRPPHADSTHNHSAHGDSIKPKLEAGQASGEREKQKPNAEAAERSSGQTSPSGRGLLGDASQRPKQPKSLPWGAKKEGQWSWKGLPEWMPKKMPNLQPFWVVLEPPGHPDKKRLMTVQDFFQYTEEEGKQFWKELDRDGDDRVSAEDVKAVLRSRKLPESYGSEFIKAARGNRWWSNSISWEEFKGMMDEREPKMLRAFTSLEVNSAGGLEPKSIQGTLGKVGVAETDEHVKAMIKALGAEQDGAVSYGKFRNFLMLLPEAKLTGLDPSAIWFEAATMVPFGPPPSERSSEKRTSKMLVTAALAGGIASCVSTVALFPLDTLKTRLQSTSGASIASVAKSVPDIGVRGLYRGIIPAATGNFVSHGVRTFSYEAAFTALTNLTRGAAELQMQGLSSGIGTFLGTCIRIPCEVLKQRLQTGRHPNMLAAITAATQLEGGRGLFRGTAATLSREVPFYVLGIVFFEQLKKLVRGSSFGGKGRELAPWETIALGALAGSLASVTTCPADVMKTRIMTSAADKAVNPAQIFADIVQHEGVGALFKGALFRAAWTAPQGAMNFSGYELAKKALTKQQEASAQHDFQLDNVSE